MSVLPRPERRILSAAQAAEYVGFDEPKAAFYAYMKRIGCAGLPDRRDAYDRLAIDRALDQASGLVAGDDYGTVNYGDARV